MPKGSTLYNASQASVAGDTFTVYYGEFLISPAPLELSFSYCSHKCGYCFANLNKPGRWADSAATMRLLANLEKRQSMEARLLRERYPVVVSNRTDPFAASNWRDSLPVLRTMTAMGIPVVIQTRGGTGWDEAAGFLPPSVWYVSITTSHDGIRAKVEPGATSIGSRLAMIEALVKGGHRVVIGINPLVPQWIPDPDSLVRELKARGAEGCWVETLHFNKDQVARMSPREKQAMGSQVLQLGLQRGGPGRSDWNGFLATRDAVEDAGLSVFSAGQGNRSEFFRPWRECYPKTFPVLQDMINQLHDEQWTPDEPISLEEYVEGFAGVLPQDPDINCTHYVGSTSRQVLREDVKQVRGYRELLALGFRDRRLKSSPLRSMAFSRAAQWDDRLGGWLQLVDERGDPYLVFDAQGRGHEYLHCNVA